ncbi:MAG: DUF4913 domain-containing protein, partial [Longispora sp.]|nr:DUF4913 domain-containing protein [Longispora sp. (in: high G+C Gram-positive bacteria)]
PDPGIGMSSWWREHLDPTWTALTSEHGPFSLCHERGSHRGRVSALVFEQPPGEWTPQTQ